MWGSLNFDLILKDLQEIIQNYKPSNIICIGQSAGGYMSILFGNLLHVNKIIAVVPQIHIFTSHMNNFRIQIYNKYKLFNFKYKNLNILQPFITYTKIYSCKSTDDITHINYLNNLDKNLSINYVNSDKTHDIVNSIGKDNYIKLIMNEISKN
jgi:hypothetical protein